MTISAATARAWHGMDRAGTCAAFSAKRRRTAAGRTWKISIREVVANNFVHKIFITKVLLFRGRCLPVRLNRNVVRGRLIWDES